MKGKHATAVAARSREEARLAESDASRARREALAAATRIAELEAEVERLSRVAGDAEHIRRVSVEAAVADARQEVAEEIAHARRMLVRLFGIADEHEAAYIGDIDDLALQVLLTGPSAGWNRAMRRNLSNPTGIAGFWRDYCRQHPEDASMTVVTKVTPLARRYELERLRRDAAR